MFETKQSYLLLGKGGASPLDTGYICRLSYRQGYSATRPWVSNGKAWLSHTSVSVPFAVAVVATPAAPVPRLQLTAATARLFRTRL